MSDDPFVSPSDRDPGDFKRTKMGAPYVSDPDRPGKMRIHSRASGYMVDPSPFNLLKWKERQLVAGLLSIYDIDIDPDDRDTIDQVVNDAYDAANTSLAADRGTHIHLLCELAVTGEPYEPQLDVGELLGIASSLQETIVKEFLMMRDRLGVTMIEAELHIVNDIVKAAGTTDLLDLARRDIVTDIGTIPAGEAVICDIKTGGLDTDRNGHPKWWIKYGPQLVVYRDGQPYDTDTDTRQDWPHTPHPDIALIYHYDLKKALNGEPVEWLAIPVDLRVAREGVSAAAAIKGYAKRRDVFAAPVTPTDRRAGLLERYAQLSAPDQQTFRELGIDKDDLDAIEAALLELEVDPFDRVAPIPPKPDPEPTDAGMTDMPIHADSINMLIDDIKQSAHRDTINRWASEAVAGGTSIDPRKHPTYRHYLLLTAAWQIAEACDGDDQTVTARFNLASPIGFGLAQHTIDEVLTLIAGCEHAPGQPVEQQTLLG